MVPSLYSPYIAICIMLFLGSDFSSLHCYGTLPPAAYALMFIIIIPLLYSHCIAIISDLIIVMLSGAPLQPN